MELGIDQLMAIIGNQTVEIITLRMERDAANQRIRELEPKPEAPKLAVVEDKQ